MNIEGFVEWAAMGRHGLYVWLAYGGTLVVLAALVIHTRLAARSLRRELELEAVMRAREAK